MPFRAIIVGGGPIGLAMARSFQLADIDYVVLEKNKDICPDMGFIISLLPQSMRLLDQFGLLEEGRRRGCHYQHKHSYGPTGAVLETNEVLGVMREYHGHPWLHIARRTVLEMLYTSNPDRDTKIRTGIKITKINVCDTGVDVTCDDGSVETGSIIIGCDGLWSFVRAEMDRMERAATGRSTNPPKPFKVPYTGLLGISPVPEGLEMDHVYETHGKGYSYQLMPGLEGLYFIRYTKTEKNHKEKKYAAEEADEMAKSCRDDFVAPGVTFGQLWDTRIKSGLWDFHEGNVKKWFHGGRVVLAGDSTVKFLPPGGAGLNNGWQQVAELTNLLRREILKNPDPDSASLEKAYETYQSRRSYPTKLTELYAWSFTRVTSWHNPLWRFLDLIGPYTGGDVGILDMLSKPLISNGVILEYVEETDLPPGTKPWKNPPVKLEKPDSETKSADA